MIDPTATAEETSQLVPENKSATMLKDEFGHITQQMYTQNLALAQTNRTLSILRAIDLLIIDASRDLPQLSTDISDSIVTAYAYAMVAIFSLHQHSDTHLQFQGLAHNSTNPQQDDQSNIASLLRSLVIPIADGWVSGSTRNLVIDLNDQAQMDKISVFSANNRTILDILGQQYNLKSLYLTKLKARGMLTGVMMVALDETAPKIDDIELIERISEPTGIALDNRLLYEENIRVVSELQKTNTRLQEIDASKDEFISMASHQLRTPLTTMKGTVSMVLDGDVGPISEAQASLLQQAFDSSQRMAYLIADLLNVSRLRTGKFVIITKETDLVEVVAGELQQLQRTADSRHVELRFVKPMTFPHLILDETKIRQVIMNFLDNAVFYTPAGGHVDVVLSVDDNYVSYIVTDTGLGVPQDAQKNLFTKFYRASNAQKARPDGTGLGLYMARKVIVAHGGTVLFHSEEGKGSTFGFRFPLAKVLAPIGGNEPHA